MTNIVLIILTNVAANSTVEWSNDLQTWQPYACTYVTVPRWKIQVDMANAPKQFWRYRSGLGPLR